MDYINKGVGEKNAAEVTLPHLPICQRLQNV